MAVEMNEAVAVPDGLPEGWEFDPKEYLQQGAWRDVREWGYFGFDC